MVLPTDLSRVLKSDIINILPALSLMEHDDVLDFAEYLGLSGTDADLFYESYYNLDNEEYEYDYDNVIEDSYESIA